VRIPVIASLNGTSVGGWLHLAEGACSPVPVA